MVFAVSLDISKHRNDSPVFPTITTSDYGTYGKVKFADFLYIDADPTPLELLGLLPNRSIKQCPVELRKVSIPAFTLGTAIAQSTGTFTRSSGTGHVGAYYNTALSSVACSIEARTAGLNPIGISLQNGGGTIYDDYSNALVSHSIFLDAEIPTSTGYGLIVIRENGVIIPNRLYAYYQAEDRVMIELENGFVRYYLIKPDDSMLLLRSVRSKLTSAPKAQITIYSPSSIAEDVRLFNNEQIATEFEMIGVLQNFQDWMNDFFHSSQATAITMADNSSQFTFPGSKRVLRGLSANLNVRTKDQRDDFLQFYRDHQDAQEFLFIDLAHKDESGQRTEFFARFASPFGDKARGSCLSAHTAVITETNRSEIIPRLGDPDIYIEGGDDDIYITGG